MTTDPGDTRPIRAGLERVLASRAFAQNKRLSRFLRYVVEHKLDGKSEEIKETVIGIEVFDRRADFDPKQDSIVRTEAARLRSRLAEYYAGEGCDDAVAIEVPKGGYVPVFRLVPALPPVQAPSQGSSPRQAPRRMTAVWAAALVGVAFVATGTWWMLQGQRDPVAIAVLPLENLNRTPDSDYLADGLTDEIIRNLSIDALSRMAVVGAQRVGLFLDSPEFASWRGDRRLADLRHRIGLPDAPALAR